MCSFLLKALDRVPEGHYCRNLLIADPSCLQPMKAYRIVSLGWRQYLPCPPLRPENVDQLFLLPIIQCFVISAGVFVGSGIFKSDHAAERAKAIVQATTHYKDAKVCFFRLRHICPIKLRCT